MENWSYEKKSLVLAEVRDALCDAFSTASKRRKSDNFGLTTRLESEKNVALLADALVKVMDKMDDMEEKQNPAQGQNARVIKRNTANNR